MINDINIPIIIKDRVNFAVGMSWNNLHFVKKIPDHDGNNYINI